MKRNALIILSIISILAIIGWMITDFFGGMIVYLIIFKWIIIPLLFVYVISFFKTLTLIIRDGISSNKILFYSHLFALFSIAIFTINNSELLKSKILLSATLKDDLSSIHLILRRNGKFETISEGIFGYTDKTKGYYLIKSDTIIFLNKPYRDDYIPDTLLLDKENKAIYIYRKPDGVFRRDKSFVNFFEVNKSEL